MADAKSVLLSGLTDGQKAVVTSGKRRVLVVAGAGSGKTEVMARRVAWWVAVENVPKKSIVAFTFTEAAAEELKFRIRRFIEKVTPERQDVTLGGMYIGTIHGFCLKQLRDRRPEVYHNFDVLDEGARIALVQRGFTHILGLKDLQTALGGGQYQTVDDFLKAYDLLNEYAELDVQLPTGEVPNTIEAEGDWCKRSKLRTAVGRTKQAKAFATAAARYYAYLRCRRFLDFSTSQSELVRLLEDKEVLEKVRSEVTHLVVDEVQDINPVQGRIIRLIVGTNGALTAVGDHRQAIYAWRGGRVEIMAELCEEISGDKDGEVLLLEENFRSTPRVIDVANRWAKSIGLVQPMKTTDMKHGNSRRADVDASHVAMLRFDNRKQEASWIASTIDRLVRRRAGTGAWHDTENGERGLSYGDIAVLIRSSTDARTYMRALEKRRIPAVFKAGPDLFSQPEVLLFVAALARSAGIERFFGSPRKPKSLPSRIRDTLGCNADPASVVRAAAALLRRSRLPLDSAAETRLLLATELIHRRITTGNGGTTSDHGKLRTASLIQWLGRKQKVRRVFPQTLFHWLLSEASVEVWDTASGRGVTAMFHLGQLSSLVKEVETPGWTSAVDFRHQVIALCWWGAENGRSQPAPLLVQPDAVTITTIHSAKGLEFGAVFLADVVQRRFPSQFARSIPALPIAGPILRRINTAALADNANWDQERRLMYVALSRAERYLFVTTSGNRPSPFFENLESEVRSAGGSVGRKASQIPTNVSQAKTVYRRDLRLLTSFSDLRYFLECPHDFYLRKVLGFAPTIDQAFGYGRGVHNLLREVHTDAKSWAALAKNPRRLKAALEQLIRRGLFYLRYTTGDPAKNMREKAVRLVAQYVKDYHPELTKLLFEPEREFETLLEEEQVLVSGAIDVLRLDDPPRVTLIDFKSGESESEALAKLDEEEMRLQISLYGLAAKKELEYAPEKGLMRYLDEKDPAKRELMVDLKEEILSEARKKVVETVGRIRQRDFHRGPAKKPRNPKLKIRCAECDFIAFCGMHEARATRDGV